MLLKGNGEIVCFSSLWLCGFWSQVMYHGAYQRHVQEFVAKQKESLNPQHLNYFIRGHHPSPSPHGSSSCETRHVTFSHASSIGRPWCCVKSTSAKLVFSRCRAGSWRRFVTNHGFLWHINHWFPLVRPYETLVFVGYVGGVVHQPWFLKEILKKVHSNIRGLQKFTGNANTFWGPC